MKKNYHKANMTVYIGVLAMLAGELAMSVVDLVMLVAARGITITCRTGLARTIPHPRLSLLMMVVVVEVVTVVLYSMWWWWWCTV